MTKSSIQFFPIQRRMALQRILAVSAATMLPQGRLLAQSKNTGESNTERPWVIAQIVDVTTQQQDVSKDFLIGSRAVWQDVNSKGISKRLQMKSISFVAESDLKNLSQKLNADTPELALFTGALAKQDRQRYILALADVNLQTMLQINSSRLTPIIAAQSVPMVNSGMPIVRSYHSTLVRLYDEPPAPHSLAGFIAASYTFNVLKTISGPLNRKNALAAFQRREQIDLGGFRVSYNAAGRGSQFVTQSMLNKEGHTVG